MLKKYDKNAALYKHVLSARMLKYYKDGKPNVTIQFHDKMISCITFTRVQPYSSQS